MGVQPLDGKAVHAGGNVDRGDGLDAIEAWQQMRPDLAGPRHQIVTLGFVPAGIAATHCARQRSVKPSEQIRLKVM